VPNAVSNGDTMFEAVFSIGMLGAFIWAVRFLLPKALEERDPFALTSAVLTAALALITWLAVGVRVSG
jgi:uncharacterized membrane protein